MIGCREGCGTSWMNRNENIQRKKEFLHPMCWNIKQIHDFGLFSVIFTTNPPDFCNFDRFSPAYDGCEGDSGTSRVNRNENIQSQKEFIHPMCWNIKKIHYFGRFWVIFP